MTVYIFTFCIIFVFLFLAALYESWSVPLAVMLAVPISAFGAIVALTLAPTLTNNVYAQIGLITLIGLVRQKRHPDRRVCQDPGRPRRGPDPSTLDAVRLRIRPIIMTSLAFILGVMPLVLASGAGGASRNTIGVTVLGGMIASSTISIFIVPVLYVFSPAGPMATKELAWLKATPRELTEKARKVEAQNIDPNWNTRSSRRIRNIKSLFGSQGLDRIGDRSAESQDAHRHQRDGQCEQGGQQKYPPTDGDTVSIVFEPAVDREISQRPWR